MHAMPSPNPIIEPLLVQARFSDVTKLGKVKIGNVLMTTLVERWRPESHMFHLHVGECTITSEDVALQLCLHVDDGPIIGPTYYDWEQMCVEYIGVVPLENALVGSTLKLKWLKEHMLTLPVEHTPQQLTAHCRACILAYSSIVVKPHLAPDMETEQHSPQQSPLVVANMHDEGLTSHAQSYEFMPQPHHHQEDYRYNLQFFSASREDFMRNLMGTNLRTLESPYAYLQNMLEEQSVVPDEQVELQQHE
ncbi:Serine/threonine-protein phosphatase 7 long form [Glycine soja]